MGSSIDFLGIAAMALIVILAAVTVAGIIFGMRLKRRRLAAEHEIQERREAADLPDTAAPPAPTPEQAVAGAPPSKGEPVNAERPSATDAKVPDQRPAKPVTDNTPASDGAAAKAAERKTDTPAAGKTAPERKPVAQSQSQPEPAPEPDTPPSPAPAVQPGKPDITASSAASAITGDIVQIKGLGPKLAAALADLGYTRVDQIAALTPEQAASLDAKLGAFQGRMARDKWIEQATLLAAGDQAGYEATFGKLG